MFAERQQLTLPRPLSQGSIPRCGISWEIAVSGGGRVSFTSKSQAQTTQMFNTLSPELCVRHV